MNPPCTHLDHIHDVTPSAQGCEDCLKTGDSWVHLRICLECGSKVLKLPYPGSPEACAAVSRLAGTVPWAVLSAGVDHATFLGQVETSMRNGASGVIAGRALWKDCISLDRSVTARRLTEIAVPRLREIQAVIARFGEFNYRRFRLYLWGAAYEFLSGSLDCYRMIIEYPTFPGGDG